MKPRYLFWLSGLVLVFLGSCTDSSLVMASDERVTFALVLDSRAYDGRTVYAELRANGAGSAVLESLSAQLADYPNTSIQAWAQFTTLERIKTNAGYFLDFYIDMDGSGSLTTGDLQGYQNFYVAPSAVWSETKYFSQELAAY